jgi:hypothetical protein
MRTIYGTAIEIQKHAMLDLVDRFAGSGIRCLFEPFGLELV